MDGHKIVIRQQFCDLKERKIKFVRQITIHYNTLNILPNITIPHITIHYNTLPHITMHYNTLQYHTLQYIKYITTH